jgi:hypothetical protein
LLLLEDLYAFCGGKAFLILAFASGEVPPSGFAPRFSAKVPSRLPSPGQSAFNVTLQALFYGPVKIFPSGCTGLTVFTKNNPCQIKDWIPRGGGVGCR